MSSRKTEYGKVATIARADAISYSDVQQRIVCIREKAVIIDVDVAALYGVETNHVNQAVRNNRDKFPADYVFELTSGEVEDLRSKILTTKLSSKSRVAPKAFTEKGLYMLATILKSKRATAATFAIIETFAKVRGLKRELVELHKEGDKRKQADTLVSRRWTLPKSHASRSRHFQSRIFRRNRVDNIHHENVLMYRSVKWQ